MNDETRKAIIERRLRVAELLAAGILNRRKLAQRVGTSVATAHRDVQAVYALWQREAAIDAGAAVVRQLAEIAKMRSEAWDAWERSKTACGDSRYLRVLNDLADREAKLLGLYKPSQVHLTQIPAVTEVVVTDRSDIPTLKQLLDEGRFDGLASDN